MQFRFKESVQAIRLSTDSLDCHLFMRMFIMSSREVMIKIKEGFFIHQSFESVLSHMYIPTHVTQAKAQLHKQRQKVKSGSQKYGYGSQECGTGSKGLGIRISKG